MPDRVVPTGPPEIFGGSWIKHFIFRPPPAPTPAAAAAAAAAFAGGRGDRKITTPLIISTITVVVVAVVVVVSSSSSKQQHSAATAAAPTQCFCTGAGIELGPKAPKLPTGPLNFIDGFEESSILAIG